MAMSNLEVDALDELCSGSKFLLGSPQLVPEASPRWPQACSFECVGGTGMYSGSIIQNLFHIVAASLLKAVFRLLLGFFCVPP